MRFRLSSTRKRAQKCRFLNAFPRMKIFENIVLRFSSGRAKTVEVSNYDHHYVIHHT